MQIDEPLEISPEFTHFSSSSRLGKTRQSPHQPAIPSTSGWVGVPMITLKRPSSSARLTMPWMR